MLPPVERALDQIFEMHGRSSCWTPLKPILKEAGFTVVTASLIDRLNTFTRLPLQLSSPKSVFETWRLAQESIRTILDEPLDPGGSKPMPKNLFADLLELIERREIGRSHGLPAYQVVYFLLGCLHQLEAHTQRQIDAKDLGEALSE